MPQWQEMAVGLTEDTNAIEENSMDDYTRRVAEQDAANSRARDVQNAHWKTQQDYNAALDAAKKRDAAKR